MDRLPPLRESHVRQGPDARAVLKRYESSVALVKHDAGVRSEEAAAEPRPAAHPRRPRTLQHVLSKPPDQRSSDDIALLMDIVIDVSFFAKLPNSLRYELCRVMQWKKKESNTVVFSQGDRGDTFYVILTGVASVQVRDGDSAELVTVATLRSGESFGELALIRDTPRSATIVTEAATEFLIVKKNDYVRNLKLYHEKEIKAKVTFLYNLPVFARTELSWIKHLATILNPRRYNAGDIVFRQGEEISVDGVFFIVKGVCSVLKTVAVPREGRKVIEVCKIGPRQYFGELALLNRSVRTASIVTRSSVEVLVCSKIDFIKRFQSKTLSAFQRAADRYLSDEGVLEAYLDNQKWSAFKHELFHSRAYLPGEGEPSLR